MIEFTAYQIFCKETNRLLAEGVINSKYDVIYFEMEFLEFKNINDNYYRIVTEEITTTFATLKLAQIAN